MLPQQQGQGRTDPALRLEVKQSLSLADELSTSARYWLLKC